MLAYLMLFAALSNAVCLYNAFFLLFLPLIFANAFCFHALSWFIETQFVYYKYYFASCTVLLICKFFLILCSHRFFIWKGFVLSGEIALKNNHYYYIINVAGSPTSPWKSTNARIWHDKHDIFSPFHFNDYCIRTVSCVSGAYCNDDVTAPCAGVLCRQAVPGSTSTSPTGSVCTTTNDRLSVTTVTTMSPHRVPVSCADKRCQVQHQHPPPVQCAQLQTADFLWLL